MLDFIVFCAIIIGVCKGLSKLKQTSYTSQSSGSLLEFLLINR